MSGTFDPKAAENEARLSEVISNVLEGKALLKNELGLSPDEIEAIYAVAYNIYAAEKYVDAMKLFSMLCMLDPLDYRFSFGGASCLQMMGEYFMAGIYFQLAAGLDTENPAPMMHTAECLLAIKDLDGAKFALNMALERMGNKAEYAGMRQKAEVILENIAQVTGSAPAAE